MKNYKLYEVGDDVEIIHSHTKTEIGKVGTITEVRHSFCKILIDGKVVNHPYGHFKKI